MPGKKRPRRERTDDWQKIQQYTLWPEQMVYELLRPVVLFNEPTAGYTGSDRSVYRYLATLKQTEIHVSVNVERIKKYMPNTAVWLFVHNPKTPGEVEQEDLAAILLASPALRSAYDLISRERQRGSESRFKGLSKN